MTLLLWHHLCMARSELYLIRHGESEMNISSHIIGGRSNETPLTERGIDQARRLGRYLVAHNILPTRVFTSPADRTIQTAAYTLGAMGVDIMPTVDDELQEMDQGEYVGRLRKEIYTPEVLQAIDQDGKEFKLTGAESMNEVGERMTQWIFAHVPTEQENPGVERTFVFGHGIAIKTAISSLYNWSHKKTYESVVENTSLTALFGSKKGWQLEAFGATPHLDER